LAEESTLEKFCEEKTEIEKTKELINTRKKIWEILHNAHYKLKHKKVTHAQFFDFGTTREIFDLMTKSIDEYRDLGWDNIINSSSIDISAYDSVIAPGSKVDKKVYIESSYINSNSTINANVILSSVEIKDDVIPNDVVLHGIKQKNGKFVCRIYGIDDNPKERKLFNKPIESLPFGLSDNLWNVNYILNVMQWMKL
jgi:fucokinase